MKHLKFLLALLLFFAATYVFAQDAKHDVSERSLLYTFFDGLRWGFISVLQPCLYAMFPVTVSFFLKRSNTRAHGIKNATIYSISIIAIYNFRLVANYTFW